MAQIKKGGLGRSLGALLGVDSESSGPSEQPETSAKAPLVKTPEKTAELSSKRQAGSETVKTSDKSANTATKAKTLETAPAVAPVSKADGDIVTEVAIDKISRGTFQPRKHFDDEALQELADSIAAQGLIQPIVLRQRAGGFELIAGERRWRAARQIGMTTIPAIVRDMTDSKVAAVTLIENIQREDLNPLEEAGALQRLKTEFKMTHQDVADAVGRSRASVSNLIRLLDLDQRVADMLLAGKIEMGHARALLSLPAEEQHMLAMKVYANSLTVRATESLVRDGHGGSAAKSTTAVKKSKSSHIRTLENDLAEKLGASVSIEHSAGNKGTISINYNSLDELDGILKHIK